MHSLRVTSNSVWKATLRNLLKPSNKLKHMDPKQESALNEMCYLVNMEDKIIGSSSKRDCHKVSAEGNIPLHRAFSVFLFNNNGHLLLQKRASEKITYPDHYTNSCCSHPIKDVDGEDDEKNAIGIKRAAQRRLNFELGIPLDEIPLDKFDYISRIYYKDDGNGVWGEHEIDYVLFLKANVDIQPNPNEISQISFVPRDGLDDFIAETVGPFTPWFELILKSRLRVWWDNLDDMSEFRNHKDILHLKD